MRSPLLPLTTLALLLSACGNTSAPASGAHPVTALSLPITTSALDAQALSLREGDVTFSALGPATVQTSGGFDYLRAQFRIRNVGSTPFDNLTLVAVAKGGNVGTTAIRSISSFGGAAVSDQASLAVRSLATHSVTVGADGSVSLTDGATDFQAFTTSEAAGLTALPGWADLYAPADRPLNYGFVANACAGDPCDFTSGRTIAPGEQGLINVALRIPHTSSAAYSFVMNFAVVNADVTRVTRSVNPAESQEAASARLSSLVGDSGGEVMTVGLPVPVNTPDRTDVNTPGLKVVSSPFVTTLAGSGQTGNANGTGTSASFKWPKSVTVAPDGTVYVCDTYNYLIRRITPDGLVSTLAGSGESGFLDGQGAQAKLGYAHDLMMGSDGKLYLSETYGGMVRSVTTGGEVRTTALGQVGSDGIGGITQDAAGNIILANGFKNTILKVTPDHTYAVVSGTGTEGSDDGPVETATFNHATGVAADHSGNVYVSDTNSNRIRMIRPDGIVVTVAGSGEVGAADGSGHLASFNEPTDLALYGSSSVLVVDRSNHLIRLVRATGEVTTLAGTGSVGSVDGPALTASFNSPNGVAADLNGDVYVSDTDNSKIRKIYMP